MAVQTAAPNPVPNPALAGVLDRLDQGVLLVDAAAIVAFRNRAADDLLQDHRGLCLRNGALHAARPRDGLALHRAIAACAGRAAPDQTLTIADPDGGLPLSATVAALPQHPLASVFVADPGRLRLPTAAQLQAHLGLTAAEAALALQVLAGDGLAACAQRLGICRTTARTHLGHIFEKTRTRRQAELVRLLLALRPGLLPR